jgi:hypothetical protein
LKEEMSGGRKEENGADGMKDEEKECMMKKREEHTSTLSILISALSFSDLSSNSTFRRMIFGFSNCFGCCSKPAYEKVFLKATPST